MEVKQIVILVFVLLVVLYIIINAFSKTTQLTKMSSAKTLQTITAADLKNTNNSSNFTYSMWIYVDDWNYKFGQEKTILNRNNCPNVVLGSRPNTLTINLNYFNTGSDAPSTPTGAINTKDCAANAANAKACQAYALAPSTCTAAACDQGLYALTYNADGTPKPCTPVSAAGSGGVGDTTNKPSPCMIDNIPIQKWVNVIISLYGTTLDTYLNGKLVRTCVLPGVPMIDNNADILVTPNGGFSGYTTTFKYWSDASNPQQAYNIYKAGFGGSILGNAFNKYRLRFSMIKDNVATGSFEI